MSEIILSKLKSLFGEKLPYKNCVRIIKINGGHVLRANTANDTVTFIFTDNTTLDLINN
jgi:hypothetical protein